jgi:hypothetical protein
MERLILKCQRCSHLWAYKGKNKFVTSCSNCKTSVYFKKNMIPSGSEVNGPASQMESKAHADLVIGNQNQFNFVRGGN